MPHTKDNVIHWVGDSVFDLNGVSFTIDLSQDRSKEFNTDFCISKSHYYLDGYLENIDFSSIRNVFELGVYRGGSTAFFFELSDPQSLVAVEYDKRPISELTSYITKRQIANRLKVYYGIDQSNDRQMAPILRQEFRHTGIDLVIDDASHLYEQTRKAFTYIFPYLNPMGYYVIEDWAWAHLPRYQGKDSPWWHRSALTNLVFELVMFAGHSKGTIEWIRIVPGMAILRAGPAKTVTREPFDLSNAYAMRNRQLRLI